MKAAIYCRLSEEDKDKRHVTDDSESIQNQKSMLIQYATEQGWEIYGIYSDDDYTGADRSRPEFKYPWVVTITGLGSSSPAPLGI